MSFVGALHPCHYRADLHLYSSDSHRETRLGPSKHKLLLRRAGVPEDRRSVGHPSYKRERKPVGEKLYGDLHGDERRQRVYLLSVP